MCQALYNKKLMEDVDYFWISDQRIKMDHPDNLEHMLARMEKHDIDCLYAVPTVTRRSNIFSTYWNKQAFF